MMDYNFITRDVTNNVTAKPFVHLFSRNKTLRRVRLRATGKWRDRERRTVDRQNWQIRSERERERESGEWGDAMMKLVEESVENERSYEVVYFARSIMEVYRWATSVKYQTEREWG